MVMKQGQMASLGIGRKRRGGRTLMGLAVAAGLLASGAATATDPNYAYLSQFGSSGSGNGQFGGGLNFVAIDPSTHDIVVEDGGNYRVEIFTSSGTYLRQFGSGPGTGNGQFSSVQGIAIDPSNHHIVVADGSGRVQIFSGSGNYLSQFGSPGSGNGQFNDIGDVAIDPVNGNIVVSDIGNLRVQIFSASGVFLGKFGSSAQFSYPDYLTIDPATHNILVGDELNANVQIFSSSGTFLRQFGSFGSGNGQFSIPGGIAIDASTHDIVVVDYGNSRVQVFDADGNYLSQFGSSGTGQRPVRSRQRTHRSRYRPEHARCRRPRSRRQPRRNLCFVLVASAADVRPDAGFAEHSAADGGAEPVDSVFGPGEHHGAVRGHRVFPCRRHDRSDMHREHAGRQCNLLASTRARNPYDRRAIFGRRPQPARLFSAAVGDGGG